MNLENRQQLENTRKKLHDLEQMYERTRKDASLDDKLREVSLQSLKRLINQFKEEIGRFEAGRSERSASLEGIVSNGVVMLLHGAMLPEGTRVTIRTFEEGHKSIGKSLLELAGQANDWPSGPAGSRGNSVHGSSD